MNLVLTRRIDELEFAMGQWAIDPEEEDKRLQETGQYNAPEDANTQFDREVAEELAKESEGGDQRQVPLVVRNLSREGIPSQDPSEPLREIPQYLTQGAAGGAYRINSMRG